MNTCKICNLEYPKTNKSYKDRCRKCYDKQYYQDNKEERDKKNKQWIKNNSKSYKQYKKQHDINYRKTEQGKKSTFIKTSKYRGLLEYGYTYDEVYEYYLEINNCEVCGKELTGSRQKCMDHCHQDGCFRWVLCQSCNTHDNWMKHI